MYANPLYNYNIIVIDPLFTRYRHYLAYILIWNFILHRLRLLNNSTFIWFTFNFYWDCLMKRFLLFGVEVAKEEELIKAWGEPEIWQDLHSLSPLKVDSIKGVLQAVGGVANPIEFIYRFLVSVPNWLFYLSFSHPAVCVLLRTSVRRVLSVFVRQSDCLSACLLPSGSLRFRISICLCPRSSILPSVSPSVTLCASLPVLR